MKVSIVTATLNSEATIRDSIQSILSQEHKDIEIIVVDGGSTDGTVSIVREFDSQIAELIIGPDDGIYDAMNKGIRRATGDIVAILNSDDIYASNDVLGSVVGGFGKDAELDIVIGDLVYVAPNDLNRITRFYSSRHFRPWKLRFGIMPPHPATFVKRHVYERHGLYSLNYKIASDYEMFVRWLVVHALKFDRVDRVMVRMRVGGVSTSGIGNSVLLNREIVSACVSNGLYTNWLFLLPKVPFKLIELVRRPS